MKLTLADKLALIYTSAGSQRKVAALTGLSHQQVGRILRAQSEGRSIAAYEKRTDIAAAIDVGFRIHSDVTRDVARQQGLPFDAAVPIYAARQPLKTRAVVQGERVIFRGTPDETSKFVAGKIVTRVDPDTGEIYEFAKATPEQLRRPMHDVAIPGDRVLADHVHWIRDEVRNAWLKKSQRSGKYYAASVGSRVHIPSYMKKAEQRIQAALQRQGTRRTKDAIKAKKELQRIQAEMRKVQDAALVHRVFTPYTPMNPKQDPDIVIGELQNKIEQRHAAATGLPGTVLADQILLQIDTRKQSAERKQKRAARKSRR